MSEAKDRVAAEIRVADGPIFIKENGDWYQEVPMSIPEDKDGTTSDS